MTAGDPIPPPTVSTAPPNTTPDAPGPWFPGNKPGGYERTPTDTVAAITIAVLAVLIVLSVLLVCRVIRKRRQARRGQQFGHIPTITTGIMGTGVSAYNNIPVRGAISWEPVTPSGSSSPPLGTRHNSGGASTSQASTSNAYAH